MEGEKAGRSMEEGRSPNKKTEREKVAWVFRVPHPGGNPGAN